MEDSPRGGSFSPYVVPLVSALTAILQSTLASHVAVLGVCPNLVLLVTVGCTLLMGTRLGLIAALSGGLVLDALSGAPFGIAVLAMVAVALITGVGETNLFRSIRLLPYIAVALGTVVYNMMVLMLMGLGGAGLPWGAMMWRVTLPLVVVNVVAMLFVYGLMRAVYRRLGPRSVGWMR